jgi:hypothetical protein
MGLVAAWRARVGGPEGFDSVWYEEASEQEDWYVAFVGEV